MTMFNTKNAKWLTLAATAAVTATGAMASSAAAATYTLDFNQGANGGSVLTNSNGTLQTNQWADWGLTNISGKNNRTNKAAKLNLYNTTTNAGGQDNDLRTGNNWGTVQQGNALIIQEENWNNKKYYNNNNVWRADDEARGGYVDFDFAEAVAFNSFSLLDIDDNGGGIMVEGEYGDGSKLNIDIDALMTEHHAVNGTNEGAAQGKSVELNGVTMTQVGNRQGDNSMFRFELSEAHFTNVRFRYPGSGAISGLEWGTIDDGPQEIPEPSAMAGLLMLGFVGKRIKQKRDQASEVTA